MGEQKPCRCCLSEGLHKDLNSTYFWMDQKEIYAAILQECFNIALAPSSQHGNGICDQCISALRAAQSFKQTVQQSEEELMKKENIERIDDDVKPVVKLEPKEDCNEDGEDSDDYILADAARQDYLSIVKIEPVVLSGSRSPRKSLRKLPVPVVPAKSADGIKSIIKKLSIKNHELTIKKKMKLPKVVKHSDRSSRSLLITQDALGTHKFAIGLHREKHKHRHNLCTILQYSNALPFKDKSLLGYICVYCEKTYPDPQDLRLHTESKHKKDRLNFKKHFDMTDFNVKIDVTDLICTLCDAKLDNLSSLKEHIVKVHNKTICNDIKDHMLQFKLKKGDVYDCAMCSATYETFKMLKQHMNIHYSNYTCPQCESSFATKRSLNAHRTTHLEGNFKCDHCDKVFASKAKKQYHEKCKHLGTRHISNCPYCDEPFRSYYQRNQHLVKVHNSEAQYKCNVCSKTYLMKSLLMTHIKKSHLMEKNIQCTECGYRFFSKKSLKAHMVKHTGEKNFICQVCQKAYARKYTLREHMRIHMNDRRFKCDVCAMSFVQKCSLKSHLLSNHGISLAASDISTVSGASSVSQD